MEWVRIKKSLEKKIFESGSVNKESLGLAFILAFAYIALSFLNQFLYKKDIYSIFIYLLIFILFSTVYLWLMLVFRNDLLAGLRHKQGYEIEGKLTIEDDLLNCFDSFARTLSQEERSFLDNRKNKNLLIKILDYEMWYYEKSSLLGSVIGVILIGVVVNKLSGLESYELAIGILVIAVSFLFSRRIFFRKLKGKMLLKLFLSSFYRNVALQIMR